MRALEGDRGDLDGNGGCDVDGAISGRRGWWRESEGTLEGELCGGEHLVVVVIGGVGRGLSLSGALLAVSVNSPVFSRRELARGAWVVRMCDRVGVGVGHDCVRSGLVVGSRGGAPAFIKVGAKVA